MRRGPTAALLVVVFAALSMGRAVAQPPVGFSRDPGDFTVGSSPLGVAAGTFTADDIVDVAVVNSDSDDVSVLIGNGDGTFTDTGATFGVGLTPVGIGVGDFNNDGKLDIITADEIGNTVSVLVNDGTGSFAEHIESDTGTSPESVFVGFFDDDEFLDAATADNFDDTVTVLKGAGDGSFTVLDVVPVGVAPIGLAGEDLNGDGFLDLVVTNNGGGEDASGSVSVLKGLGDGHFEALEEIPIDCGSDGCAPVAVAIATFNADTNLDLAVVNEEADSVSILLGNGDLTFRIGVTTLVGSFPEALAVEDFNLDGKADIATSSNFQDNVVVLVGVGDGTFLPQASSTVAQDAAQGATTLVLDDASRFPATGTVQVGAEVLDYASRSANTLTLSAGLAQAVSAQTVVVLVFPAGSGTWGIASADFNEDGKPDLATSNQDDESVSILLNVSGEVSACVGDCDDTGAVTVDDIIKMVNIALGTSPIADCLAGDANGDGEITVDDILKAVNNALTACLVGVAAS